MDYRDGPAGETDSSVILGFAADGLKEKYFVGHRFHRSCAGENLRWHKTLRQSRSPTGLSMNVGHHEINNQLNYRSTLKNTSY